MPNNGYKSVNVRPKTLEMLKYISDVYNCRSMDQVIHTMCLYLLSNTSRYDEYARQARLERLKSDKPF